MASRNQPRPRYGKALMLSHKGQEYCKAFTTAHFPPSRVQLSQRNVARRHHARQEVARLQAQIKSNLQQDFSLRVTAYHTLHKPCLGRRMSSDCTSPGQVSSRGVRSHGLCMVRGCASSLLAVDIRRCLCRGASFGGGWRVGRRSLAGWCPGRGVRVACCAVCRVPCPGCFPFRPYRTHQRKKYGLN